ncbi:MAG: Ni/Fe hydrogenase subunit alpha [Candidatus Pacearchaeota archaeon]|jgi:sulfhydrogenase subunit alpha
MAREINLNHICKIEGHASLSLEIEKNKIKKCKLKTEEGARFFEALVLNKNVEDIQEIVSRICGICSCSHSVCSIQALEEALQIQPSQQQKTIREILLLAERIRSHATHLYFLSLPDFFNASSALSLPDIHKNKINDALKIVSIGNKIVEEFGGREMHPFLKIKEESPDKKNFNNLITELKNSKPIIQKTIKLFSELNYPDLKRETDYLSIKEKNHYPSISGKVFSNNKTFIDDNYKNHLKENIKEYATSKFVLKNGKPYMLGAMARINNCSEDLDDETKKILFKILKKMKLELPLKNPYHNLICQAIEILEAVNKIINLLENIPNDKENQEIIIKAGNGVSSVEAPRGTLFHEYKINKEGKISYCNIITPTCQNLNMIEEDITTLVNKLLKENSSKEEIVNKVEKLIRAYDPCFSCSSHFLKVNWL